MANAFSTKGSTTNNGVSLSSIQKSPTSLSPMTKALDNIAGKYGATTQGTPKPSTIPTSRISPSTINKATSTPQTVTPKAPVTPKTTPTTQGMVNSGTSYQPPVNTGTNTGMVTPTPQVTTPSKPVTPTPTYSGLVGSLAQTASQPSEQYTRLTGQAEDAYKKAAGFTKAVGQAKLDATTNPEYSLDTGVGLGNRIQQNYGMQMQELTDTAAGLANLVGLSNTQQGLQQTGLTSAAGLAAPQAYGLTSQPYNPLTDTYGGGGAQGAINRGIQAGNISSATELTGLVNDLQSTFNGVDANFELLKNTAAQGNINDANVPILNTLQQNVARGLASNEAVINFRNTLAAVRSGYANILGGGTTTVDSQNRAEQAIPDNISLNALNSLGEQLKAEATNRIQGINQQIQSLSTPTTKPSSSPSSGNQPLTWDNLLD